VWYRFVASQSTDSVIVAPVPGFDPVLEVFSGSCSALTSLGCSDGTAANAIEKLAPGTLIPGQTYFVRVYGWAGATGNFNICVRRLATPTQAGDNCSNAIPYTNASLTSCNLVFGSTTTATPSSNAACTGFPDDDVWYTFTASVTGNYVFRLNGTDTFDGAMQIFQGSCTALTSRACLDRTVAGVQEDTVLNLTGGTTVFVRIYHADPGPGGGEFSFCAFRAVPPPNDACINAISLPISAPGGCSLSTFMTYGATQSQAPINCGGFTSTTANDVWFVVTPTTSSIRIFVDNIGTSDPVIEAFTGTSCASLASIGCKDDSVAGLGETLFLSGLTPGQNVYFRVYGYAPQSFGYFRVCVSQAGCSSVGGTATANLTETVSNGKIVLNIVGGSPGATVQWQVSFDGTTYTNAGIANAILPDTFFVTAVTDDVFFVRGVVTVPGCTPANSTPAQFTVKCATPITNKEPNQVGGSGISFFSLGNISNSSTTGPLDGSYQNFRSLSTPLCIGRTYPLGINGISPSTIATKIAWIDFNRDGDFSDAGENILTPTAGSGAFSQNILIPSSATPGNSVLRVMYVVTGAAGSSSDPCFAGPYTSGEIEEYTVDLSAPPTQANAGPNSVSCNPTFTLQGNQPSSGTGTWTVVSGNGVFTNANAPGTTVNGLALGANVFRWTVATSCTTSTSDVTITYTGPTTIANAGADQNICAVSTTLSGNAPGTGGSGTWTLFQGTGVIGSPNSPNSTVTGLGSGINRFIWTLSTTGCPPSRDTVTINRSVAPTPASAGQDQTICGNSATLSAAPVSVGNGLWTLVSGSGQIQTPTQNTTLVTGLGSGVNTFRWTTSNGTCPASQDDIQVSVTPSVQAQAGSDQILCSDQAQLQGNAPGTGSGTWTLLSGAGVVSNPSLPNASVSGLGTGLNLFVWTISNGSCPATKDTVVITRVLSQQANAGIDASVCGGSGTLQATPASFGTGLWTLVSGSGQIANPSDPNSAVTGLGNGANVFRWTITNAPCPLVSDEVTLTNLGNATISNAGADQNICSSNGTLAGNVATFGIGQWSLISGTGTISAASSPNSTVTGLGVGLNVFRWTITNGNCPPSVDDVVLSRVANPSVANAGQDQNLCVATAQLSASTPSVGTGVWTLVAGAGLIQDPSSPTTQVVGLSAGANTFRWTVSNAPCAASTDEIVISTTINAVLSNAGQDQALCNTTTQLSANNPGNGTGLWTVVSGTGTFTNPNAPNSEVTNLGVGENVFRWTITTGACTPSSDEVIVSRISAVTLANAGADQNLCTSVATLLANVPATGVGQWSLISGTGTIANPSDPNTTVTGLGNGTSVFRWTITNFPCPSSIDEVSITTTLSAVTANAGTDQTICGTNTQLIGNSPGTGNGQWTLVQGSGNITNFTSNQTSVTALSPGVNVFSWTITTGSCPPSSDQVTITVVTNPVAANAGADQNICGSSGTLSGNNPGNAVGTWTLVSGSGQVANPSSPNATVVGLGNGANVFRWTLSNAPCPASFDEVTLNATPSNITANAGTDRVVCGSSTFLNGVAPVSGFGVWSVVSGTASITQPGNPVSEITNLGPGTNTFAWTVTSGSCSASGLVSITREISTLNLGPDSLACIGTPVQLNAGPGFSSYSWFDQSTSPSLSVGSSGTYWVQVQTSNGCTYRDSIKVTFVICTQLDAPSITASDKLELFPNPGNGHIQLILETALTGIHHLRVYNSTGVVVWEGALDALQGKNQKAIDLRPIPAGMYFLEVQNEKGRKIQKLIVR
jgi:hypothetical protein